MQSAYPVYFYMHRINAISVEISGDRVSLSERMNKVINMYLISTSFTTSLHMTHSHSFLQNMILDFDLSSIQDRSKIVFC